MSPLLLGIVVSAGGVGSLIGSFFASRVVNRLGFGPAIIWMATGASIIGVLTPLAGGPIALATLMVFLPQLIGDGLQTIEGVAELSLIQGVIPDRILGRVNATLEVFSHGIAYPLGALLAAALAGVIGVRGGIAIGWAGMALSILLLVFSAMPANSQGIGCCRGRRRLSVLTRSLHLIGGCSSGHGVRPWVVRLSGLLAARASCTRRLANIGVQARADARGPEMVREERTWQKSR